VTSESTAFIGFGSDLIWLHGSGFVWDKY